MSEPSAEIWTEAGFAELRKDFGEVYAGRTVLVVGSGHSAFNAILDLARLRDEAPGTTSARGSRSVPMPIASSH